MNNYFYLAAAPVVAIGLPLMMLEPVETAKVTEDAQGSRLKAVERTYNDLPSITAEMPLEASVDEFSDIEKTCLALNIYHEARGEDTAGQVAVGLVARNRVQSKRFPNSYCEVVKEDRSGPALGGCQFSWYCDGKSDIPKDMHSWAIAINIAGGIITETILDTTDGADHYYAPKKVSPVWRTSMTQTVEIGNHRFYRS